jgi:hypothetical protein
VSFVSDCCSFLAFTEFILESIIKSVKVRNTFCPWKSQNSSFEYLERFSKEFYKQNLFLMIFDKRTYHLRKNQLGRNRIKFLKVLLKHQLFCINLSIYFHFLDLKLWLCYKLIIWIPLSLISIKWLAFCI